MKTKKIREIICMLKRKYDFVGNPQHGLIKVIRNKKYGFVDINMKIVIPLEYDWSSSFCRIKLYGKQYIGAYVSRGGYKTIIAIDGTTMVNCDEIRFLPFVFS